MQDRSECSDNNTQTEIYSQIATPPPESSSEYESDEEEMSTKAEIKIRQPATFDGKAADASYWIRSVHTYISLNIHIYDLLCTESQSVQNLKSFSIVQGTTSSTQCVFTGYTTTFLFGE